jgi:hypothetical protein
MFGSLKRLLYGATAGFRPYESQCLEWFAERLPEDARRILAAQIESFDFIHRSDHDWCVEPDQSGKKPLPLFPNRGTELCAARLDLLDSAGAPVKCDFIFHEGELLRIIFGAPPKKKLSSDGFSLLQAEVYEDLMQPDARERKPPVVEVMLPEPLRGLDVTDLAAPAKEADIAKIMRRLGPTLPQDYVDLLRITDGFTLEEWKVHGLRTWTRTHSQDGVFTYLAEGYSVHDGDPQGLIIRQGDAEPKVYLRDEIDDLEPTEMGSSFIDALLQVAIEEAKDEPDDPSDDDTDSWPPAPKV